MTGHPAYDTGYKRPPKRSRFSKGVSGNPSGRPKKSRTLDDIITSELTSTLIVKAGGKRRRITKLDAFVRTLVNDALNGDASARRLLVPMLDRIKTLHPMHDKPNNLAEAMAQLAAFLPD